MRVAVITDDRYYYNGVKKISSKTNYVNPVKLIAYYDGLSHVKNASVILIKIRCSQIMVRVIEMMSKFYSRVVFVEDTRIKPDDSEMLLQYGKYFFLVKKVLPGKLLDILNTSIDTNIKTTSLPLTCIKACEWRAVINIMKFGSIKKAASSEGVTEKMISSLKCNVSSKLFISGVNTATEVNIIMYFFVLYKQSFLELTRGGLIK